MWYNDWQIAEYDTVDIDIAVVTHKLSGIPNTTGRLSRTNLPKTMYTGPKGGVL